MKRVLVFVLSLILSAQGFAQTTLKFHDGGFKILQFTDSHIYNGNIRGKIYEMMDYVIDTETPDFIIFTGDIICDGGNDESKTNLWKQLCEFLEGKKVPYAIVLGNHDAEFFPSAGRKGIYDLIREFGPHCLNNDYAEELSVCGVKDLPVYDASGERVKSVIYCLDSGDYPPRKRWKSRSWYDWMHFDEIDWHRRTSASYTEKNGGQPVPSVAFFHICVPEFNEVVDRKAYFGNYHEDCCPASMNSGFFLSAFTSGDIMGMFVGHDHSNDFCGMFKDIALCYGRQSGVMWDMPEEMPIGGRVIVLKEGLREFDTWTRDQKGKGPVWSYPFGMFTEGIKDFNPAVKANVTGNGVAYRFYQGTEKDIKEGTLFTKKNLKDKGVKGNLLVPEERSLDYFGYEFDTYLYAPQTAQYNLNFHVNEGAIVYIDGVRLNGKPGDPISADNLFTFISWEQGYHHLQVRYYEETGKQKLRFDWRYSRTEGSCDVPDSAFFAPEKPDFKIK